MGKAANSQRLVAAARKGNVTAMIWLDKTRFGVIDPASAVWPQVVAAVRGVARLGITTQLFAGIETRRAAILAVPGSGPVRGVAVYLGTVYAWRNNAGATAMNIYKSTSSGWTLVPLGYEMAFDTGSLQLYDGDVITGQTSGATATITRVVVSSGSWSAHTAAGYLTFASVTGTFQAGENLRRGTTTDRKSVV